MASKFTATSVIHPNPKPLLSSKYTNFSLSLLNSHSSNHHHHLRLAMSVAASASGSSQEGSSNYSNGAVDTEGDEDASTSEKFPSTRAQLDLLEQLSSTSTPDTSKQDSSYLSKGSIRDQLLQLVGSRDDNFSIPLGKNLKKFTPKFLTISQKRNIRRQAYLNEVSQRNDSVFFATVGAFVLVPPLLILGIAILTGYVQLFP